jgi:hypothetical protein
MNCKQNRIGLRDRLGACKLPTAVYGRVVNAHSRGASAEAVRDFRLDSNACSKFAYTFRTAI